MFFLRKLFGKKDTTQNNELVVSKNTIQPKFDTLMVHQDLKNLLWIGDGPNKNYIPKDNNQKFEYEGISIKIEFLSFSSQEPSLIFAKLPIKEVNDINKISRPSYYPTYAELTNEQRGVYWKLLADPYTGEYNIGYVFLLYYGLERQLLEGDFENAFNVILKLRDVYDNRSFQSYSACALILTCLTRQRSDLVLQFYQSLDKSYEFNFSDNLYLLCKMGLRIPLTVPDIIRMSKTFEFTNQNYIKKYPDLFLKNMRETMKTNLGFEEVDINKYITSTELKKLRKYKTAVFANMSISDQTIDIPMISESFKLKKIIHELLEQTHEKVKKELAKMRKNGITLTEKKNKSSRVIEVIVLDVALEKRLLSEYNNSKKCVINQHFALNALEGFYYKYRELDEKYLQICIDYCNEDILLLPELQLQYIKREKERIQNLSDLYSEIEINEKLSSVNAFEGNIPAFKRLAIIFEKNKDYSMVMQICNQAIAYYDNIDMHSAVEGFAKRKKKLESKILKSI